MAKKKVMVVDDAAMMRIVVQNILRGHPDFFVAGYAENGKTALAKLPQIQPDLILLDIEMPEMNGLEFLRHARLKSKAKIVILSSVAGSGSRIAVQALSLGADAIVTKPSGAVSYDLDRKTGQRTGASYSTTIGSGLNYSADKQTGVTYE